MNTHPEQWGAIYAAAPLGAIRGSVSCSRAPQSRYWRWREHWIFTPPPTDKLLPFWDSNPQPFDYESNSLNIRPQLLPEEAYLRNIECHQVARRLNQSETRQGKARQGKVLYIQGSEIDIKIIIQTRKKKSKKKKNHNNKKTKLYKNLNRLEWANAHNRCGLALWRGVIFTDESRFSL